MHAMRPFRRTLSALAIVATTTLAACKDSSGPGTIDYIDASGAAAAAAPIAEVFDQSVFESMAAAGTSFSAAPTTSLAAVANLTRALRDGQRVDARAVLLARSAAPSLNVVPLTVRGNTYVYDVNSHEYVEDAAATGAPANGIRVVIYALDAFTGQPATPLNRIGYVDLIDQSTSSTDALRVLIVREQGSQTLADYVISGSQSTTSASFGINGWASNGTTTVNFNLNMGFSSAGRATITFKVSVPSLAYSVSMQTTMEMVSEEQLRLTERATIAYGGHTLAFNLSGVVDALGEGNDLRGDVRYDGKIYATLTVGHDPVTGEPTAEFVKANGEALTQQELDEISNLFERAFDLGSFWVGLLWPLEAFQG